VGIYNNQIDLDNLNIDQGFTITGSGNADHCYTSNVINKILLYKIVTKKALEWHYKSSLSSLFYNEGSL
jgi:hypothetical protein